MIVEALRITFFFVAAIPGLAFPLLYHFTTHGAWRKSAIGRSMMTLGAAIALLFMNGVLSLIFPDSEVVIGLRLPLVALLAVALWAQSGLLLRIQHSNRKACANRRENNKQ